MRSAAARRASTSSTCATTWKRWTGTSGRRDRHCPHRSSRAPARSTSKPCSDSQPKRMSNWPWDHLDAAVFSRASGRPGALRTALRIGRYPYAVIRDMADGQINMRATGLVFTTMLSLVPLLAFSFIILHQFGAHAGLDLQPIVLEFFRPIGADADDFIHQVLQFAGRLRGGVVGVVGLTFLAWSLIGTIQKVEDSFNY